VQNDVRVLTLRRLGDALSALNFHPQALHLAMVECEDKGVTQFDEKALCKFIEQFVAVDE
jgi:hypothetical protein